MSKFSSPLPLGCRFTSGFGHRWGVLHAGTDYGPPKPGQSDIPVFALADATIIAVGYGYGRSTDVIPYHSGRYVWYDIGTHGGDRMRIYNGHLASISVRAGQKVKAGEQIGVMGGSGKNGEHHFATHLHLGVAQNHSRPVNAAGKRGAPGWINPHAWLLSKGITVGKTAPIKPGGRVPQQRPTTETVRSEKSIRQICIAAGHGNSKTSTFLLVQRYQHRQNAPFQLVHDSVWGSVTEQHYQWVLTLQRALNQWRGSNIPVDGDYRNKTNSRVRDVQYNNRNGLYKGYKIDGVPGPVFCKMIGIPTHP